MARRRSKWPLAMSFAPSVSSCTGRVMRLARAAATTTEARIDNRVRAAVPGALGQQMLDLMNSAIDARASVGVIGLGVALWVGLNWLSNLRLALTEMWRQSNGSHGYIRTKFSDLAAMVSSFVAIFATLALSALAGAAPMGRLLEWLGVHDLPGLDAIFRAVSVLVSFLLSWLVFGWMIARLPRDPVNFASSVAA